MDFLWHNVSEEEKKEIKSESEKIMNNFSKRLEKVKIKERVSVAGVDGSERDEGSVEISDLDKEIMFSNAPKKNKDSIIAERGEW
ncbi:MAG: hypothetical protein Q8P81_00950 [Nanoarchaeota archaeon]|nr:hypothetical protein [Nanoarchaeota archaeon]